MSALGRKPTLSYSVFKVRRRLIAALRSPTASLVHAPCLQAPLAAPVGAPVPRAPPCILQTRFPFAAGDRHWLRVLV